MGLAGIQELFKLDAGLRDCVTIKTDVIPKQSEESYGFNEKLLRIFTNQLEQQSDLRWRN